jgi:hypothetical protein
MAELRVFAGIESNPLYHDTELFDMYVVARAGDLRSRYRGRRLVDAVPAAAHRPGGPAVHNQFAR